MSNLTPEEIVALGPVPKSMPGFSVFNIPPRAEKPAAKVRLFVQVYASGVPERQKELDLCLAANKANPFLDEVVEIHAADRVTFREFFDRADAVAGPEDVSIFANSDIRFDETAVFFRWLAEGDAWCLSRMDAEKGHHDGLPPNTPTCGEFGADVWAVRGKIGPLANCGFGMGLPFCDYAIAARLYEGGYKVYNPALSVRTWHHHASGFRTYSTKDQITKPWVRLIYPATLHGWAQGMPTGNGKPAFYDGNPPPYERNPSLGEKRRETCKGCKLCRTDGGGCQMVGPRGVHCTAQGCRWFDVDNRYATCPLGKW